MWMTTEQIRCSYREAAYPKSQIGILAQLNACDKNNIKEIVADIKINKIDYNSAKYDRWTTEQSTILMRLYEDGIKPETIARRMGVSIVRVYNKLDHMKKKKAAKGAGTPATAQS